MPTNEFDDESRLLDHALPPLRSIERHPSEQYGSQVSLVVFYAEESLREILERISRLLYYLRMGPGIKGIGNVCVTLLESSISKRFSLVIY